MSEPSQGFVDMFGFQQHPYAKKYGIHIDRNHAAMFNMSTCPRGTAPVENESMCEDLGRNALAPFLTYHHSSERRQLFVPPGCYYYGRGPEENEEEFKEADVGLYWNTRETGGETEPAGHHVVCKLPEVKLCGYKEAYADYETCCFGNDGGPPWNETVCSKADQMKKFEQCASEISGLSRKVPKSFIGKLLEEEDERAPVVDLPH